MPSIASHSPHILVVDDDREIRDLLNRFLRKQNFRVTTAADGLEMRRKMENGSFDLIVLDIMLPGEDGLSLCRWIYSKKKLPVIMLTAMGDETDRIVGLEIGADDYLSKPFNSRELLARIRAVLRRAKVENPILHTKKVGALVFEGWQLNIAKRELYRQEGDLVPLTSGEYELLFTLAERPYRVLTREQLLDLTRGREIIAFDRSIDVQVSRLRRKIEEKPTEPKIIKMVRNGGYLFAAKVEKLDL